MDQRSRATRFRELHAGGTFVIANCLGWRLGAHPRLAGFSGTRHSAARPPAPGPARRTASASKNRSPTRSSSAIPRICRYPADLEKGFGDAPADAARAIRAPPRSAWWAARSKTPPAARTQPIFDLALAAERVAAAVEAARALPFPFTLTARAENFLQRPRRSRRHHPPPAGLRSRPAPTCCSRPRCPTWPPCAPCARRCRKPVNFMVGIPGKSFSVAELTAAGVRRISLATSLYRAAMTGLIARRARDPRVRHVRLPRPRDAGRRIRQATCKEA